ncbi:MAG: type II toxin-antitoxin system RelE/ParE family toxin [Armatimonadetes bacterium]|nr:type II toxin-antitoxin system RelE/ParE family toxin [Armatimonadota bacterium]
MDTIELAAGSRFRVVAIREAAAETGPVERYLLGQTEAQQVKLLTAIRRFADRGPTFNTEQCKMLKGQAGVLVELKVKAARLLGFYCPVNRGVLVLTHGFNKKSRETPAVEIKRARDLREEYLQWLRQDV